jgi:predicted transport protein
VVKKSGLGKQMEITNWLKAEHKLNHLQASLLAGLYLNNGKPVYQNETSLLDNQFAKCEEMRPLYNAVSEKILKAFSDTQLIPKKTYLSFTATREFAAINIKPKEIRLGVDLGISHMLTITDISQFDKKVNEYLQESYNRSHKK